MCLPHGSYDFDPTISTVDAGGVSRTGLPRAVDIIAGCGQHLVAEPPINVVLLSVPAFANLDGSVTFQTFANSSDEANPNIPVSSIESLTDAVLLCDSDCGDTPTATFTHTQAAPPAMLQLTTASAEVSAQAAGDCQVIPIGVRATSPVNDGISAEVYDSTIPRNGKLALGPGRYEILWRAHDPVSGGAVTTQSFAVAARFCHVPHSTPHHGAH